MKTEKRLPTSREKPSVGSVTEVSSGDDPRPREGNPLAFISDHMFDGIQFHRKADRLNLRERIEKEMRQAAAVARIASDINHDERLRQLLDDYEHRVGRLEADLREAYGRNAEHLIQRAMEGNRVVTTMARGGGNAGR